MASPEGHSISENCPYCNGALAVLDKREGLLDSSMRKYERSLHLHRQIGNNRGHINGWVGPSAIYGRATEIGQPTVLLRGLRGSIIFEINI